MTAEKILMQERLKMMKKDYTISLDIGTTSVGWAVLNDDFTLAKGNKKITTETGVKKSRTNLWGVRLFEAGQVAEGTRLKRGMRRRLARRKKRLELLREIFCEEILKFDESFFIRMDESFYQKGDDDNKTVETDYPLFNDITGSGESYKNEVAYYDKYPTIYHLRYRLMSDPSQADLRLVYFAVHHILKYRGHFIDEERTFNFDEVDIQKSLEELLIAWNLYFDEDKHIKEDKISEIEAILKGPDFPSTKVDYILGRAKGENAQRNVSGLKLSKEFEPIAKIMVGNQGNLKSVFGLDEALQIKASDENVAEHVAKLDDEQQNIINLALKVNNDMILSQSLLYGSVSAKKVNDYELHKKQLKDLRHFLKSYPELYEKFFGLTVAFDEKNKSGIKEAVKKNKNKGLYTKYIQGAGDEQNKTYQTNLTQFYKEIRTAFKNEKVELPEWINTAMELENFLPKQRLYKNGSLPYQAHCDELKKILENQSQYYEFLKWGKEDQATDEMEQTKIARLMTFRIPYYVGPLAKNVGWREENGSLILQKGDVISKNSWLVRKSNEKFRPWNFDDLINQDKSEMNFIKRMTNFCTYLPKDKALPAKSMLYQRYNVLNRLTKVKINEQWLSPEQREAIFEFLFAGMKQNGKVSKKELANFWNMQKLGGLGEITADDITGIDGRGFLETYTTFHDFKDAGVPLNALKDDTHAEMFETMVEWLTIFGDEKPFIKRMKESYASEFDDDTIKKLAKLVKRYKGWGRFSSALLTGIRDQEQHHIIWYLMKDEANRNLMQLIHDDDLIFKNEIERVNSEHHATIGFNEQVEKLATSPANKRGILQSLKIVDEIVNDMGYLPTNIAIEFAREKQSTAEGTKDERKKAIKKALDKLKEEFKDEYSFKKPDDELKKYDNNDFNKRLQLYYLQNGKCMYTLKPLEISDLSQYDMDHIIPRSLLKNDSIENLALVTKEANRKKGEHGASKAIKNEDKDKVKAYWKRLYKAGVLSSEKYSRLRKEKFSEEDIKGFINRQLVETRQIMKNVATILRNHFKDEEGNQSVEILTPKSMFATVLRKQNNWHKLRDLNDYHHAHDAYLNGCVALFRKKMGYDATYTRILSKIAEKYPNKRDKSESQQRATELRKQSFQQANDMDIRNVNQEREWTGNYLEIRDEQTGEPWWSKEVIDRIENQLYGERASDLPLVTYKTERQRGPFSKEGNLKAGRGSLCRKNNLPIALYGGSNLEANSVIVLKSDGTVEGIPFVAFKKKDLAPGDKVLPKFQLIKNAIYKIDLSEKEMRNLENFYKGKNTKAIEKVLVKLFEYAKENVDQYQNFDVEMFIETFKATDQKREAVQFILDENEKQVKYLYRYLTAPKEAQLAHQLMLNQAETENLKNFLQQKEENEMELHRPTLEKMIDAAVKTGSIKSIKKEEFLSFFDTLKKHEIEEKVEIGGKEEIITLGQIAIIKDLLNLISRGTSRNLTSLGKISYFGFQLDKRYISEKDTINNNSTLIYQSPTGLYETHQRLT